MYNTDEKEDLSDIDLMIKKVKTLSKDKPKRKGRPSKSLNNDKKIAVNVTKHQEQFLNFTQPNKREQLLECLFAGSVGAGKSTALVLMILKYAEVPNTICLMLHLHLSSLKKSTLPLLIQGQINIKGEFVPPLLPPECIESFNKSDGIIYLTNGSKIILSGVGDAEKLKSINAHMAVIDELTNLDQSDYFSILQRCRLHHPLPNGVFAATNPSSRSHWVWKYFVENKIPGYREMISVTSYSNKNNLPTAYLKSLENLPEQERRKMLLGEWIQSGSSVFYTFDTEQHIKFLDKWNKSDYQDFILSTDFGGGGVNAYSGAALIGKTHNNIYHVLEEFTKTKTTHKEMLDWLEQYRELTSIVVYDSANAALASDLENASWTLIKSIKDIEGSVAKCNGLFKDNRIILSSKCPKTIAQLENAVRQENTNKINKLVGWDLIDAFRYGVCAFDDGNLIEKHSPNGSVYVFTL